MDDKNSEELNHLRRVNRFLKQDNKKMVAALSRFPLPNSRIESYHYIRQVLSWYMKNYRLLSNLRNNRTLEETNASTEPNPAS